MNRRALFVGNWQGVQHNGPSHQRIRALMERWKNLFGPTKQYKFSSLSDQNADPNFLYNPSMAELVKIINDDSTADVESVFLFYYVGHSTPEGESDIRLTLKVDDQGRVSTLKFSQLMAMIYEAGIRKAVIILDTCHSGRVRNVASSYNGDCYVMVATGSGYAFDAEFSERMLRTLEREPHQSDQRIDRKRGGITYEKLFKVTMGQLRNVNKLEEYKQIPIAFGSFGSAILQKTAVSSGSCYNPFAGDRTVYGRLHFVLSLIATSEKSLDALVSEIRNDRKFRISGDGKTISKDRVMEYIEFSRKAGFAVIPGGTVKLTDYGRSAVSKDNFNKYIIEAINSRVFPNGVDMDLISSIVKDLLDDAIQPSPINIKSRLQMDGKDIALDGVTRMAFQVMAFTGLFIKGSAESLFPSELG